MKVESILLTSGLLISLLLLSSCASTEVYKKENFSGYLADYSRLERVKLDSDRVVLRWVNPKLKRLDYNAIIIEPTGYYQGANNVKKVGGEVMTNIQNKLSSRISKLAKSSNLNLVKKNGPKVLRLQSTIAAIKFNRKDYSVGELIPLRFIFSAIEAAAGGRDYEVTVFFEFRLIDSVTKEIMSTGVRQGKGKTLSNSKSKLSQTDLDNVLDQWAKDWEMGFQSDFFNLTEKLKK